MIPAFFRSQLKVLRLYSWYPPIPLEGRTREYRTDSSQRTGQIVISGISGRFPKASTTKELNEKLLKGEELTTETKFRWTDEKLATKFGFLHCLDKFDAGFFNLTTRQAHQTDPQIRLLLEASFEAIVDAGMNPTDLRGSETAVICGAYGGEAMDYRMFHFNRDDEGYHLMAGANFMIAARIAFNFDLRGPSSHVCTACSSSFTALEIATNYIEAGKCEAAIVTGSSVRLSPYDSKDYMALKAAAPDGRCKTFDESGKHFFLFMQVLHELQYISDGYVRSEAAVAILLQKEADARRCYARIKGLRSSSDGFKHAGIMHPARETQEALLRKTYEEAGVELSSVSYLEAHGTGTPAGDPEELHAVHRTFCQGKGRDKPLLIGSVKTNIGHSECAAGLCGVAKVIGAIQSGTIPGNLFFNKPHPEVQSLFDGSLKVLTEPTAFDGGVVGLSSIGIGGTNCHLILEPGPKKKLEKTTDDLPILLPISGRSEAQVEESIAEASTNADNPEFVYLLQKAYERNIAGHNFRGFGLLHVAHSKSHVEVTKCDSTGRPVWVIFPGMGSQWTGMGQDLLRIQPFAESVHKSRMTLRNLGVDLDHLLKTDNQSIFSDIHDAFVVIAVMQMALWDTLKEFQIRADGFIGHSAGECLCAYADGCYTAEETLQITHARGRAMKETHKVQGGMSSIGMSPEEIHSRLPPGIQLACYNTPNNVTISGELQLLTSFTKQIKDEGRFAVSVNSCGTAAHSSYVKEAGALLKSYAKDIIKGDRPRSPRWISTSIPEAEWGSEMWKFASAEYIENNVCKPVLFSQACSHVQPGSVVVEVSPKGFFQALLAQMLPNDCIQVAPMTAKADDKLWHFLQSMGRMYTAGLGIKLEKIYPSVSTPVGSNVPSLSHLVKWDHSASWKTSILDFPMDIAYESTIDIKDPNYAYLTGHNVNDRFVMPATGLLCGVWNQLGDIFGRDYESFPVQFNKVVLSRATTLVPGVESTIVYKINSKSGQFTIENQDDIVVTGKIEILSEKPKLMEQLGIFPEDSADLVLSKQDIYKESRLRGYNYTQLFQGIESIDGKGRWADICWNGNWTCFLDAMLQTTHFSNSSRHFVLPVDFEQITIDPVEFKKSLQRKLSETGKNVVRVVHLENQNKIVAPGIEIKGMQARIVPQMHRRGNVAYERHTFCPLFATSELELDCFEKIVDLVLENHLEQHLEVADVFIKKENTLARDFHSILSRKPRHDSTMSMITLTTEAEMLAENSNGIGNVLAKDNEGSLRPQIPTDLVFVDDASLLPLVLSTVKSNGFVLVHTTEPTASQHVAGLRKCSTRLLEGKTYELYRKAESDMPQIVHLPVDSADFEWVPKLQEALRNSKDSQSKIFVTSQGDYDSGILGLVNCLRFEDGGERIRCIFDPQAELSLNFKEPDAVLRSIIFNDLFINVLRGGTLGTYRHVGFSDGEAHKTTKKGNEAFLGTLTPADLSSLSWIESPSFEEIPEMPVRSSDSKSSLRRYKVAYAPLNFRDVLLATTNVPLEPEFSYRGPYLGFEFAGFDEDGRRVMGICHGNGLATSVMTDPRFVWEVPEHWTLEEAATVPVVYATVLYAFHTRARLQPGQTVLIHAGTGGVGQAAISVALAHGCRVFTTVGTPEKREYIKKAFPQLTDDFIGNSRDTTFEAQVMDLTGGRGVDVALNSLAGDKLLATLRCVAVNGTFLEIGVFDAFMNTQMGLRPFLKNIDFCGAELLHVVENTNGYDQVLRQLVNDGITSGAVKPLPRKVYECNQVEDAFRFMASGKHMGKLVVKIRDESNNWGKPLNLPSIIKRSYFSSQKTYLIVGGLGGFGLEVAGWMVERGARKLVLTSRSGVTNGYQAYCLRRWRETGVEVETPSVDLSDELVAELYMRKLVTSGETLGGVFNSALHLCDEEFMKQTVANFHQVSKPKVNITNVLDQVSRKHYPNLDYFVVFSSISCGRGNADQTNYGWANSAMERICEKRREDGLHGLAIQWGILGQVGVVAEKFMKGTEDKLELQGTQAQTLHSCLEVLDAALQQSYPVVSSCVVAEKGRKQGERVGLLMRMEKIFGITDFTAIPADKKLSELGLDSLVAVELKQTLEREHEISLTKEHLQLMTVGDVLSIDAGTFDVNKLKRSGSSQEIYSPFKVHKTSLVSLKSHPSGQNAFIVYGADGGCDNFKPLASRLNANVYGFQFAGKDGWNSIPQLASLYAREIKAKQLVGPYTIMGFSAGTAIAFEMAKVFQESGETIQNLVFLDGCPSYEKGSLSRTSALDLLNAMNVLRKLSNDSIKSFESALTGDAGQDFLQSMMVLKVATGYELTPVEADAYAFLTKQLSEHVPCEPYNGDVILVQATEASINVFAPSEDYNVGKFCTGQVIQHKVKGNHLSFLSEENVDETADVINDFLN